MRPLAPVRAATYAGSIPDSEDGTNTSAYEPHGGGASVTSSGSLSLRVPSTSGPSALSGLELNVTSGGGGSLGGGGGGWAAGHGGGAAERLGFSGMEGVDAPEDEGADGGLEDAAVGGLQREDDREEAEEDGEPEEEGEEGGEWGEEEEEGEEDGKWGPFRVVVGDWLQPPAPAPRRQPRAAAPLQPAAAAAAATAAAAAAPPGAAAGGGGSGARPAELGGEGGYEPGGVDEGEGDARRLVFRLSSFGDGEGSEYADSLGG